METVDQKKYREFALIHQDKYSSAKEMPRHHYFNIKHDENYMTKT